MSRSDSMVSAGAVPPEVIVKSRRSPGSKPKSDSAARISYTAGQAL